MHLAKFVNLLTAAQWNKLQCVPVKSSSRELMTLCPFDNDMRPSDDLLSGHDMM